MKLWERTMNSTARKLIPVYEEAELRRYAVRLSDQSPDMAVTIEDVEDHADAAIAFAEQAAFVGRAVAIVVTDCETGCSISFVLDFQGGSIGSC